MSAPVSAKSLMATLELIRNCVRAGKSLDEAITEAIEMLEDWGSRDGELRTEPRSAERRSGDQT